MDMDVREEGNMKKSFELVLVFTQNLIQVTRVVTVQCQPSDVNLMFTTSMFEVLSVATILIAFSTALSEQRENNLNSGAWPGPFSFSLKNRKANVFAV